VHASYLNSTRKKQSYDGLLEIFGPITLHILRLLLEIINQTCIVSKSIMLLPNMIFLDSAIFIENKTVTNLLVCGENLKFGGINKF
jgi:hypothetical protein